MRRISKSPTAARSGFTPDGFLVTLCILCLIGFCHLLLAVSSFLCLLLLFHSCGLDHIQTRFLHSRRFILRRYKNNLFHCFFLLFSFFCFFHCFLFVVSFVLLQSFTKVFHRVGLVLWTVYQYQVFFTFCTRIRDYLIINYLYLFYF